MARVVSKFIFVGRDGMLPMVLKQAMVCLPLKKPSLDPTVFDHYWPILNLLFLGKVVKEVVTSQLKCPGVIILKQLF